DAAVSFAPTAHEPTVLGGSAEVMQEPAAKSSALTFDEHVLPIFRAKCISCHGGLSKKAELDLRTLASAKRGGERGPGVRPGNLDGSGVWQFVAAGQMPPAKNTKLTDAEKATIRDWILAGAK